MTIQPYQILGLNPPFMLGRQALFDVLFARVTKDSPDHTSVVGYKHYGKTVLLAELGRRVSASAGIYAGCAYADVRHNTPKTDVEFRGYFAERLANALRANERDLASILASGESVSLDELAMVLDELDRASKRVLVILDGFDAVLTATGITRNWWDNLRDLAQHPSLCLVTGSRRPLRELCVSEESQTSDFWQIFDTQPMRVGPFNDKDWDALLEPFGARDLTIDSAARRELVNWTGSIPLMAISMLSELYAAVQDGSEITKQHVDNAASALLTNRRDLLEDLWADLTEDAKLTVVELTQREISAAAVADMEKRDLFARGIVELGGQNRLRVNSRLVEAFAKDLSASVSYARRLFGGSEQFVVNMPGVLELRVLQIPGLDPTLKAWVQRALRAISDQDDLAAAEALVFFRNITDRALDLIWNAELGTERRVPADWLVAGDIQVPIDYSGKAHLPSGDRSGQRHVLRAVTSSRYGARRTRHVSQQTSILVDVVGGAGDFGQHLEGAKVDRGFALAACFCAVELSVLLTRELAGAIQQTHAESSSTSIAS